MGRKLLSNIMTLVCHLCGGIIEMLRITMKAPKENSYLQSRRQREYYLNHDCGRYLKTSGQWHHSPTEVPLTVLWQLKAYKFHSNMIAGHHNLVPPPIKIELFKHSFTYQGIVIWNSLSLNMKMAPSLSSFKKLYLEEQFSTLWPEELNV